MKDEKFMPVIDFMNPKYSNIIILTWDTPHISRRYDKGIDKDRWPVATRVERANLYLLSSHYAEGLHEHSHQGRWLCPLHNKKAGSQRRHEPHPVSHSLKSWNLNSDLFWLQTAGSSQITMNLSDFKPGRFTNLVLQPLHQTRDSP